MGDMTPKAVTIGAALVLGGALLGMNFPIADALWGGPYGLSSSGSTLTVWRMNQRTGQVSLCLVEEPNKIIREAPTPRATAGMTPQCSPWGPAAER